jgi:hypothetical protein
MKGLSGGSSPNICITLWDYSSKSISLIHVSAASTSLFSSLILRAS